MAKYYVRYKYDFTPHVQGDTFNAIRFTIIPKNGMTSNVTSVSAVFDNGVNKYELVSPTNITIINNTSTSTIIQIDEQIIDWQSSTYRYDITLTFASGKVKSWIYGKFTVIPKIS